MRVAGVTKSAQAVRYHHEPVPHPVFGLAHENVGQHLGELGRARGSANKPTTATPHIAPGAVSGEPVGLLLDCRRHSCPTGAVMTV
jgi:hypothetical protein